jgi:UDPglucose 6-dehydrogenase
VAVDDFMKPDRVVIGTTSDKAINLMNDLYAPFVRQGNPIIFMDERSAELTKYAANAFLAVKISFMNEIAQLCESEWVQMWTWFAVALAVMTGSVNDFYSRGSDTAEAVFRKMYRRLAKSASEANYDFRILDAVMEVNERQKLHLMPRMLEYFRQQPFRKACRGMGTCFQTKYRRYQGSTGA